MGPVRKIGVRVRTNKGPSKWYDEEENIDGQRIQPQLVQGFRHGASPGPSMVGRQDRPSSERDGGVDD